MPDLTTAEQVKEFLDDVLRQLDALECSQMSLLDARLQEAKTKLAALLEKTPSDAGGKREDVNWEGARAELQGELKQLKLFLDEVVNYARSFNLLAVPASRLERCGLYAYAAACLLVLLTAVGFLWNRASFVPEPKASSEMVRLATSVTTAGKKAKDAELALQSANEALGTAEERLSEAVIGNSPQPLASDEVTSASGRSKSLTNGPRLGGEDKNVRVQATSPDAAQLETTDDDAAESDKNAASKPTSESDVPAPAPKAASRAETLATRAGNATEETSSTGSEVELQPSAAELDFEAARQKAKQARIAADAAASDEANARNELATEKSRTVPRSVYVLIMCALIGALGAFLRMIGSVGNYAGARKLYRSWLAYYYLMPAEGAVLGLAVYLVFCSGLDAGSDGGAAAGQISDPIYIYALALLAGAFAKNAMTLLKRIADAIFGSPSEQDALAQRRS